MRRGRWRTVAERLGAVTRHVKPTQQGDPAPALSAVHPADRPHTCPWRVTSSRLSPGGTPWPHPMWLTSCALILRGLSSRPKIGAEPARRPQSHHLRGVSGAPEILLKLLLTGRISADDVSHAIRYRAETVDLPLAPPQPRQASASPWSPVNADPGRPREIAPRHSDISTRVCWMGYTARGRIGPGGCAGEPNRRAVGDDPEAGDVRRAWSRANWRAQL
jgi:hypothetical protein